VNLAHSYFVAARTLELAKFPRTTFPDAPVRSTYFHAAELYLKSFLLAAGRSETEIKRIGHKVLQLAEAARALGLRVPDDLLKTLELLDNEKERERMHYFQRGWHRTVDSSSLYKTLCEIDSLVCEYVFSTFQVDRPTWHQCPN
jgi:hypothetical protein